MSVPAHHTNQPKPSYKKTSNPTKDHLNPLLTTSSRKSNKKYSAFHRPFQTITQ